MAAIYSRAGINATKSRSLASPLPRRQLDGVVRVCGPRIRVRLQHHHLAQVAVEVVEILRVLSVHVSVVRTEQRVHDVAGLLVDLLQDGRGHSLWLAREHYYLVVLEQIYMRGSSPIRGASQSATRAQWIIRSSNARTSTPE